MTRACTKESITPLPAAAGGVPCVRLKDGLVNGCLSPPHEHYIDNLV